MSQMSLEELIFLADSQDGNDAPEPEFKEPIEDDNNTPIPNEEDFVLDDENTTNVEEPEIVDESTEPEVIEETPTSEEPQETSIYSSMFDVLKEIELLDDSILPEDFEFKGDSESLSKALEIGVGNLKKTLAQSLVDSFPEEMQPVMEYVLAGGKNVNNFLQQIAPTQIDYDSLDLEDVNTQRQVMYQYYKESTKYDDDKIFRLISKLESSGALAEEAEDSINDLKNIQQTKAQQLIEAEKQAKAAREQQEEARRAELITAVSNQIKDSKRQNKVKAFLVNVSTTPEGTNTEFGRAISNIAKNPEHLAQLADILLDYDPTKGLSFDRIKSKLTSEATSTLQQKLEEAANKTKVSGKGTKVPTPKFD